MPFAARFTDPHACALVPAGPILPPCCPTVIIGFLPAARMGDLVTCIVPNPIVMGSTSVTIGFQPAARMLDPTACGGIIAMGCPTVIIGG